MAIPEAAAALVGLLKDADPRVRLRAAEAILNRAGITEAAACLVGRAERTVGGQAPTESDRMLARLQGV